MCGWWRRVCLGCVLVLASVGAWGQNATGYVPVRTYDPSRNAAQDVLAAEQEGQRSGRNVLVDVGGNWCVWCHIMDRFFQSHADLAELRDKYYVTVFVNFSPENRNREFLSRFPRIPGFPHLFVLDSGGKLLRSQFTGALEQGNSYSVEKMREFLLKWEPTPGGQGNRSSPAAEMVRRERQKRKQTRTAGLLRIFSPPTS